MARSSDRKRGKTKNLLNVLIVTERTLSIKGFQDS
ncbi:hypothetical protein AEAC466_01425 [Asticcacaulis sp. AC466]|nr:hypothetical protein AEAC466_01425 [Asticcacaulis sp. AC466]